MACVSAHAETLSFDVSADAYSEPASIRAFTSKWQDSYSGGDTAFAQGRAEITLHQPERDLAVFWRYDYLLKFTPETALLVYDYKNGNIPTGGQYPLSLQAHYSEAYGLRWQPFFQPTPNLTLGVGFSLLKGYKLTEGQVHGLINLNGQRFDRHAVNNINLAIDYHYDEPELYEDRLDWHPRNPSGEGFSVDLSGLWRYRRTTIRLQINDIIGMIYWRDTPTTRYQARYQAAPPDHELTGQLAIDHNYRQPLPTHGFIEFSQQWSLRWSTTIKVLANRDNQLATLSSACHWRQWQAAVLAEPQSRAWGLELRHPGFYLRWLADSLNTNDAHRLGLTLGLTQAW